jgi:hypothetical protein
MTGFGSRPSDLRRAGEDFATFNRITDAALTEKDSAALLAAIIEE